MSDQPHYAELGWSVVESVFTPEHMERVASIAMDCSDRELSGQNIRILEVQ